MVPRAAWWAEDANGSCTARWQVKLCVSLIPQPCKPRALSRRVERQREGLGQARCWIRRFLAGSPDGFADGLADTFHTNFRPAPRQSSATSEGKRSHNKPRWDTSARGHAMGHAMGTPLPNPEARREAPARQQGRDKSVPQPAGCLAALGGSTSLSDSPRRMVGCGAKPLMPRRAPFDSPQPARMMVADKAVTRLTGLRGNSPLPRHVLGSRGTNQNAYGTTPVWTGSAPPGRSVCRGGVSCSAPSWHGQACHDSTPRHRGRLRETAPGTCAHAVRRGV